MLHRLVDPVLVLPVLVGFVVGDELDELFARDAVVFEIGVDNGLGDAAVGVVQIVDGGVDGLVVGGFADDLGCLVGAWRGEKGTHCAVFFWKTQIFALPFEDVVLVAFGVTGEAVEGPENPVAGMGHDHIFRAGGFGDEVEDTLFGFHVSGRGRFDIWLEFNMVERLVEARLDLLLFGANMGSK